MGKNGTTFVERSLSAIDALMRHSFWGNLRELKNLIEGAVIESNGREIRLEHLRSISIGIPAAPVVAPAATAAAVASNSDYIPLNLDQVERVLIQKALAQSGGNPTPTAVQFRVSRLSLC